MAQLITPAMSCCPLLSSGDCMIVADDFYDTLWQFPSVIGMSTAGILLNLVNKLNSNVLFCYFKLLAFITQPYTINTSLSKLNVRQRPLQASRGARVTLKPTSTKRKYHQNRSKKLLKATANKSNHTSDLFGKPLYNGIKTVPNSILCEYCFFSCS